MNALERAKQKIRDEAERRIAELEEASALAAKYGMTLAPVNEVEPVAVDEAVGRVRRHNKSWRKTILDVVPEFPEGVTRANLKSRLAETHLAQRLAETDAAFYGTVSKAIAKGELIEHNGHLFTPFHHRRFVADVKAGRRNDVDSSNASQSGNKPLVIDFVAANPGADSEAIFLEIQRVRPESMTHKNSVYNLLSRMVRDNEIAKSDKRYYAAGSAREASAGVSNAKVEEARTLFDPHNSTPSQRGK